MAKALEQKFVFVTGGVVSSVGKGLVSAGLAALLEARGRTVSIVKCDPYINVDPGTLSPFQHGEVYVTRDGAETDLDFGHYERFTKLSLDKNHSVTTGQVYQKVINRERRGDYLGRTVQVIPHITDEIKSRIFKGAKGAEITVVEIGGTVGDIEGLPFIEAIRQIRIDRGAENTVFAHVTFVPFIPSAGEFKSKPSQHSVKALREVGLQPDFLICRSERDLPRELKEKIALFSSLSPHNVIPLKDADSIYEIPLLLNRERMDDRLIKRMSLKPSRPCLSDWQKLVKKVKNPLREVKIGLVGKYVHLRDSYQSIHEALAHGGLAHRTRVNIQYMDSEKCLQKDELADLDGVLVPGGFGERGLEGKLTAIRYCRENKIPFFGICLGMQLAAMEFARNVCRIKDAASREFSKKGKGSKNFVIDYMPDQKSSDGKGASMRLGSYPCRLSEKSKARKIYGKAVVEERHRHRCEFNFAFAKRFEEAGMRISGLCSSRPALAEILEISDHPWFIAVQFHPEFQSKPSAPHPLFAGFVGAVTNGKKL